MLSDHVHTAGQVGQSCVTEMGVKPATIGLLCLGLLC